MLYLRDHFYRDLEDLRLWQGWCTGAIIPKLEHDICILSIYSVKGEQVLPGLLGCIQMDVQVHDADL